MSYISNRINVFYPNAPTHITTNNNDLNRRPAHSRLFIPPRTLELSGQKICAFPGRLYGDVFSGLCCTSPILVWRYDILAVISPETWLLLALSSVCQGIYYTGLGMGYQKGDMSIMYPLSRAMPVLLVPPMVAMAGAGVALSNQAIAGILLVVAGGLLLPLSGFQRQAIKRYQKRIVFWAFLAALGTAGYSVIDDHAMSLIRQSLDIPAKAYWVATIYIILQMGGAALSLFLLVGFWPAQRRQIKSLLQNNTRFLLNNGLIVTFTYLFALCAMAFVDNVSYVVALRQASIPIGVLMGVFWLHESAPAPKRCGVVLLVLGLVMISL